MVHTQIEIAGSPAKVREVFLDFERYPEWHTAFVKRISSLSPDGKFEVGSKVHCEMKSFNFDATMTKNDSDVFAWRGDTMIGSGEHSFEFKPSTETPGGTTFVHQEIFTGLMGLMMWLPPVGNQLKGNFQSLNVDLKKKVESSA